MAAKIASANAEVLLIAQVETARGVENVEAIAAVEGHRRDLDRPGRPDDLAGHPRPVRPTRRSSRPSTGSPRPAAPHGKVLGYLALDVDDGKAMLARGFRMLAYGGDLWLYQQALRQGIAALRSAATSGRAS